MINNDDISLFGDRIISLYILIFFIDDSDEFKCDIVLKIDSEVGEKEDNFFDDSNVGFQDEVLFDGGINIF